MNVDSQEIAKEEQQQEQSVQDTQLPNVRPQQITSLNTK